MKTYILRLRLYSDATFGRGDGVAGLVDAEVEHDELGLPFLRGRALKGLLAEECANLLYALTQQGKAQDGDAWYKAAQFLFGQPGSNHAADGAMHVGDAQLPQALREAVSFAIHGDGQDEQSKLRPEEILEAWTDVRRQTAMSVVGVPHTGSLRTMRVVLRDTVFEAELTFRTEPKPGVLGLLSACVAGLRRVGLGRNRGRGRVAALLVEDASGDDAAAQQFTHVLLKHFVQEVS